MSKPLHEVESDLVGEIAELARELREEREDPFGCTKRMDELSELISELDEYLQEIRASLRWAYPGDF